MILTNKRAIRFNSVQSFIRQFFILIQALVLVISVGHPANAFDTEEEFARQRGNLVTILKSEGIRDERVLAAINNIPRHYYVPVEIKELAYADHPLPIGYKQTISQPYIVAFMTEALQLKPNARVLEIGTGSGYQAAVLAQLAHDVYSIEIVPELAASAATRLKAFGYSNVTVKCGNGYLGWPEKAPFDAIIVTAAPDEIPQPLIDQLGENGRLVIPVGSKKLENQKIVLLAKHNNKIERTELMPVRFVEMTGKPK